MAVQQWTTTGFELTPAGDASPAEGDDRIRELKETAGSLLDKEHIARDAGSTAAQGWHREGSAIVYYEAAEPTNRPDDATALGATDAGRLWYDSDDGSLLIYTGSAWTEVHGGLIGSTEDNLASFDASGRIKDSGFADPAQALSATDSPTFASAAIGYRSVVGSYAGTTVTKNTVYDTIAGDLPNGTEVHASGYIRVNTSAFTHTHYIVMSLEDDGSEITVKGLQFITDNNDDGLNDVAVISTFTIADGSSDSLAVVRLWW